MALYRTGSVTWLIFAASCATLAQAAPPPSPEAQTGVRDTPAQTFVGGSGVIRGRVTRLDNGQPLRGVSIRLTVQRGSASIRDLPAATTDDSGRFELPGLPAAEYILTATRSGFVTLQYGQARPNQSGRPVVVGDGEAVEQVDIALPRGGVVAGHLLDEAGDPVTGAVVQVLRQRYVDGRRQLTAVGLDQTDDRGQFRVHGMPPGTYFLAATVQRAQFILPEWVGRSAGGVGSATAYYPGSESEAEAQPLTVGMGQELTDLAFVFRPPRLASISGIVTFVDGRPAATGNLRLSQRMPFTAGGDGGSTTNVAIRTDGSFVVPNLPPGPYSLTATIRENGGEAASAHVVLDGSDLVLALVLSRGRTARGRIVFDTGKPPEGLRPSLSTITLSTRPLDPDERYTTSGLPTVRDDWTFEIAGLTGRRHLNVRPPSGWNVKSVRVGDIDVTDTALDFSGRDVEGLEVVLTNRISDVTGTVRDSSGRTVGDATIVLLADDPAHWGPNTRFVAVARPDQSGRFRHRGLPPARYIAIALDYLEPGEETNPETLAKLRALGVAFTLGEGESKALDVSLSTVP
jgi:hypothetical protein